MPATTAKALANRKGFTVSETGMRGQYRLIDKLSFLPELNPRNDALYFSLGELTEFLRPLRDRLS
jgi:hypothetical protein